MARKPQVDQSKISFAPSKSRRSAASANASAKRDAANKKIATIIDQPRLRQRNEQQLKEEENKPTTYSQQRIDDIFNGQESQTLLKELYKDRMRTPRFHQDDLSIGEKILRFFDVSDKYGPAQGLTRLQRWHRADKLGKRPPQHVKTILEAAQQLPDYETRYAMSIFGGLH